MAEVLGIIASTIAIIQATTATYKAIQHLKNLPKAFEQVSLNFPLVEDTLKAAQLQVQNATDQSSVKAIEPILRECEENTKKLQDIFEKINEKKQAEEKKSTKNWSPITFYRTTVRNLGKSYRVEGLMQNILKSLKDLAINQIFKAMSQKQIASLEDAINKLAEVEPSVPDSEFEGLGMRDVNMNIAAGGKGNQAVNRGGHMETFFDSFQFNSSGGPMSFGTDFLSTLKKN